MSIDPPTFTDCRRAALRARRAPRGRRAARSARPRGVGGVWAGRAPIPVRLRHAQREGRLAWRSSGCFALLETPPDPGPTPLRWLGTVDRYWDSLILLVGVLLAFAVILAAGLAGRADVLLVATAGLVTTIALVLTLAVARGIAELYRVLIISSPVALAASAVGQLAGRHAMVTLLHCEDPDDVGHLLDDAVALTRRRPSDVLLLAGDGVTEPAVLDRLRRLPGVTPLPGTADVLVVERGADRGLRAPGPPRDPGRIVPWLVAGVAVVVGVSASFVARAEQDLCGTDCDGRPATYWSALYWLANRMLGGDPEDLGAASAAGRVLGLAVSVMSAIVVGAIVGTAVRNSVDRVVSSGAELADTYNARPGGARDVGRGTAPVPVSRVEMERGGAT